METVEENIELGSRLIQDLEKFSQVNFSFASKILRKIIQNYFYFKDRWCKEAREKDSPRTSPFKEDSATRDPLQRKA
jgi:hypothetical protein